MKILINDGMTLKATASANGKSINFTYRPALAEAVMDYQIAAGRAASGAERMRAFASILVPYLQSWDVEDGDDSLRTAPITVDTLNRIPPYLLNKMVDFITGYEEAQVVADLKK
jgi:hypothetical protein